MARVEGAGQFEPAHLAQWLETTRVYLFADLDSLALQANADLHPREGLFREAVTAFARFRAEIATSAQ